MVVPQIKKHKTKCDMLTPCWGKQRTHLKQVVSFGELHFASSIWFCSYGLVHIIEVFGKCGVRIALCIL